MIAALLISLREGLEASLIIGIVFSYLKKTGQTQYRKYAWAGVAAAVLVSAAIALGIQAIGAEFEGTGEQIFEGTMMLLAVGMLTWMIFWMRIQARTLKSSLESELALSMHHSSPRELFAVTFLAVVREGVETALLLAATAFMINGAETVVGTGIGLALAALIGVLLYASVVKLNVRAFFNVTSVLLLLFAAGMFASSLHEFQEAGLVMTIQEHVWNTSAILSDEAGLGLILKALFGYNSSPSLMEVIGYVAYWVFALVGMPWLVDRRVKTQTVVSSPTLTRAESTH